MEKKNPILIDTMAVEIVNNVDIDFSQMTSNLKEINQIAWIARSKRFDAILNDFLKDNPNGTIINIGCGLDTTYERINNKSVMWYDLDLPDVIELRKKFLKESDKRKFIACSFLDSDWLSEIPMNKKIMIVSSCVFVYYEESVIRDFIVIVADKFPGAELLFDVTSPKGLRIANQVIKSFI